MMKGSIVILAAVAGVAASASAQTGYSGSSITGVIGTAKFDTIKSGDPLGAYSEAGLNVTIDTIAYQFAAPGTDGSGVFYPNGGDTEQIVVSRIDGFDFNTIEWQTSHGFGGSSCYVWAEVFNNGGFVTSIDWDATAGDYIGISGGGFDEVRLASYNSAAERDAHNPSGFQAMAIDNLSYNEVPAPGALALLGLGGLAAARRRR